MIPPVYDHHAKIVVAKTTDGEIGILPKHAPIIVPLAIDDCRLSSSLIVSLFRWHLQFYRHYGRLLLADYHVYLQEYEKVLVGRARRVQFFLSQNFNVAEQFTGQPGSYVPVTTFTVRLSIVFAAFLVV
jgi:hypothetical protein